MLTIILLAPSLVAQAVVECDAGSPNLLDGGWEVCWESGETAQLVIKKGEWSLFGNSYALDLSDPAHPTFAWPPAGELLTETFNVGSSDGKGGFFKHAMDWIAENHPDEGWTFQSRTLGEDEESGDAVDFVTYCKVEYEDSSTSQTADIPEEDFSKLQTPGYALTWALSEGGTVVWRRTVPDKAQTEAATATGLVATPAGADATIDPSKCFSIVRRSKKKYDCPIGDLPKVTPKLPPPPTVFEHTGEQQNAGHEFVQEAWTNSTYAVGQIKGPIKAVNVVAEAEGKGALKLCLFHIEGSIMEKTFTEDDMVDISSAPVTQLRIVDAQLVGYETVNLTRQAQVSPFPSPSSSSSSPTCYP